MFVKDYFKNKPDSFDEDDVFVCESRYSAKAKAFKKIKVCLKPYFVNFYLTVCFLLAV